jgi:hypothetical protein
VHVDIQLVGVVNVKSGLVVSATKVVSGYPLPSPLPVSTSSSTEAALGARVITIAVGAMEDVTLGCTYADIKASSKLSLVALKDVSGLDATIKCELAGELTTWLSNAA